MVLLRHDLEGDLTHIFLEAHPGGEQAHDEAGDAGEIEHGPASSRAAVSGTRLIAMWRAARVTCGTMENNVMQRMLEKASFAQSSAVLRK